MKHARALLQTVYTINLQVSRGDDASKLAASVSAFLIRECGFTYAVISFNNIGNRRGARLWYDTGDGPVPFVGCPEKTIAECGAVFENGKKTENSPPAPALCATCPLAIIRAQKQFQNAILEQDGFQAGLICAVPGQDSTDADSRSILEELGRHVSLALFFCRQLQVHNDRRGTEQDMSLLELGRLQRHMEIFQMMFESSHNLIAIADDQGTAILANSAWERMFGYAMQTSESYIALMHPDDREKVRRRFTAFLEDETDFVDVEYRWLSLLGDYIWMEMTIQKLNISGKIRLYMSGHNITDRKQYEEELRQSEKKYRLLVENLQEGIWLIDRNAWTMFVNDRMAAMLGYTVDDMLGRHLFSFMDEQGKKIAGIKIDARKQGIIEQHDFEFIRKDGSRMYATLATSPVFDAEGNYDGSLAAISDITERRRMEERLEASLEEKEILLREVHHRVKNNLQIVASLLHLQSRGIEDERTRQKLLESRERIYSMSLIHEMLYESQSMQRINISHYIRSLSLNLYQNFNADPDRVRLSANIDPTVELNINAAIPCGLIINEILTNALKYAFPDERGGEIRIVISQLTDRLIMEIGDTGVGMADTSVWETPQSLGLRLIKILIEQLFGEVVLDTAQGTRYRISFPV